MEKTILVGFDPSLVNLGVATYDPESKKMKLKTGEFQKMVGWVSENVGINNIIAVVENPALDSTVFNMWGMVKNEIEDVIHNVMWKCLKFGFLPKWLNNVFLFIGFTKKKITNRIDKPLLDKCGSPKTMNDIRSQFLIAMKYAQSVGENKAAAKLLICLLKEQNIPVIEIAPSQRDRADRAQQKAGKGKVDIRYLKMPTKTNSAQFQELTGWKERSNEHNRDAATLVWGRNIRWAQMALASQERKNRPSSYPATSNHNYFILQSSSS